MSDIAGSWNAVVKSPLGDMKSVLTVNVDGDSWSGTNVGDQGAVDIKDGKVDGNTLTWKMDMVVPMPMTLDGKVTVDGDAMTGTVTAGAFGAFPMTATRA